jgi:hypothetical protein
MPEEGTAQASICAVALPLHLERVSGEVAPQNKIACTKAQAIEIIPFEKLFFLYHLFIFYNAF